MIEVTGAIRMCSELDKLVHLSRHFCQGALRVSAIRSVSFDWTSFFRQSVLLARRSEVMIKQACLRTHDVVVQCSLHSHCTGSTGRISRPGFALN